MNIANALFFEQVEAEIATGRSVEILVKGYSMQPLLRNERDRVVLASADVALLTRGDIVLFRHKGRHVLHRIARRERDRFTLAGDGNYGAVEHCTAKDIVAVVTSVVRRSGRIVPCRSLRWRLISRGWVSMPLFGKKIIQRIVWKLDSMADERRRKKQNP